MDVQFNIRIPSTLRYRLRVVSALRKYRSTEAFARYLLQSHPLMDERISLPEIPKREKQKEEDSASIPSTSGHEEGN